MPNDPNATKLLSELLERMPPLTAEDMAATLAERDRGELIELDEAFARLGGVGKEEWLQKVASRREQLRVQTGAAS